MLAALRATGAHPRPSLVLLAHSAAGIIALFPVTPGGLGVVEASLSGPLMLAGVRAGYAVLATLAYRIASYWLPLLAGPPAYLLFRHRYGQPIPRRATPDGAADPDQGSRARLPAARPGGLAGAASSRRPDDSGSPQPGGTTGPWSGTGDQKALPSPPGRGIAWQLGG